MRRGGARRDAPARDVLRIVGERLGLGIANLVNVFDPKLVAIGGGVCAAGDLLLEPSARRHDDSCCRGSARACASS